MPFDELFGLLLFLYILGSVFSALMRRGAPGPGHSPDVDEDDLADVLDMEELERRLREAREGGLGQPRPEEEGSPQPVAPLEGQREDLSPGKPSPASSPLEQDEPKGRPVPEASAPVPTPVPTQAPTPTRPAVAEDRRSEPAQPAAAPMMPRAGRRPVPLPSATAALGETSAEEPYGGQPEGSAIRPAPGPSGTARGLPAAAVALLERDQPWLAAMVLKEVWDQPRAVRPHRVWPRV